MTGQVFNIEKYHIHDGAGIRTAVFLKGCHMQCPWCSNPESQSADRQIVVHKNLCRACLMCERACPRKAVYHIDSKVFTNMDLCDFCGKCVDMCPYSAREIFGKEMDVEEVMAEVLKDAAYYNRSGGGVTLTGGEPLLQPGFVREIAMRCKQELLNVAVETTGMVDWKDAWEALEHVDEILMDVKTTEPEKLKLVFGQNVDGAQMLRMQKDAIKNLMEKRKAVIFRCVIVPGFNYYEAHVKSVIGWAKRCGVKQIDLLPFHQFGKHKYESLCMDYPYENTGQLRNEDMEPFRDLILENGLRCEIGG